jgi:meso-butanediol dehydrogenase/(S,S)-butanediol dehydrogenase/diacetyl reductase
MGRLENKVALITGAASGIGAACAVRFAQEGATIAGVDVQKPVDDGWTRVTQSAPGSTFREGVDVRSEEAVAAAVGAAVAKFGRIDVLVNAAGVGGGGNTHELAESEWDRVVDINLKGSFLVSKHVLAQMVKQRYGNIIHLASVEGLEGMSNSLPYNASKGGVVLMTKNMAIDYGSQGIRVNCLCPGLIETPLTAMLKAPELKFIQDQMRSWHVLDRLGKPEEVAACALFLASDDASFVTGHSLVVDGGWTAGRRVTGALEGLEASAPNWVVKE